MDEADDDGQAAPPDPAASSQASTADNAPPEPNQSAADAPAPAEPNVCIEHPQSGPATSSASPGNGLPTGGTSSPDTPAAAGDGIAPDDASTQGETPLADSPDGGPATSSSTSSGNNVSSAGVSLPEDSDAAKPQSDGTTGEDSAPSEGRAAPVDSPPSGDSVSPGDNSGSGNGSPQAGTSQPGDPTQPLGTGGTTKLTDAHCAWLKQFCGKDPRDADQSSNNGVINVSDNASASGSLLSRIPPAPSFRQIGEFAVGVVRGAEDALSPGGITGLLPTPMDDSKPFALGRGLGQMAAGVGEMAAGASAEVVGGLLDVTGIGAAVGVPVNVAGAAIIMQGGAAGMVGAKNFGHAMMMQGEDSGSSSLPPSETPPEKSSPTETSPENPSHTEAPQPTRASSLTPEQTILVDEIQQAGTKISPEKVIRIEKMGNGKIIFIETGNSKSGLQHILDEHAADFARKGIL